MAIPSKWDQECKLCGATWKKGDMIDKQPSGKWCTNPNCVDTSNPQQTIPTQQPAQQSQSQSLDEVRAAKKAALLKMNADALDVATSVTNDYWQGKTIDDTGRKIFLQCVYKECMAALRESKA